MTRNWLALAFLSVSWLPCFLGGGCAPPSDTQDAFFDNGDFAGSDFTVVRPDLLKLTDGGGDGPQTGPIIVIKSPAAGSVVSKTFTILADVSETVGPGIDDATVFVTIGNNNVFKLLMMRAKGTTSFSAVFADKNLSLDLVLPLITVTATDKAGVSAEASEEAILDEVGPALDLDPPSDFHVSQRAITIPDGGGPDGGVAGGPRECSNPFDPVGDDAPSDGESIYQLSSLRARIEDRGNGAPGQNWQYFSLVDPARVRLFVYQGSEPLIIDSNKDGYCDTVNPSVDPALAGGGKKAATISMAPVSIAGSPDWKAFSADINGRDESCVKSGYQLGDSNIQFHASRVCPVSVLTYFLPYTSHANQPAIWSIPPIKPAPDALCLGLQFDAANNFSDGPLCAAVEAYDNVGNRSVSRPIRLCLEKSGMSIVQCASYGQGADLSKLPSCTDGCTPGRLLDNQKNAYPMFPKGEIWPLPQ